MSTAARSAGSRTTAPRSDKDERRARAAFLFFVAVLVTALLAFLVLPFVG